MMKIRSVCRLPFKIVLLPVLIILLMTSCAGFDALFHREKVHEPVQPVKIKVIYNGNGNTGGTVPVEGNIYDPGAVVPVRSNTGSLILTDCTFTGWNTNPDGSGTGYNALPEAAETFIAGDKDINLYAAWSRDIFIKAGDTYAGAINGCAVHIEKGGIWDMTGDSEIIYLDLADGSIVRNNIVTDSVRSNGYSVYYDENYDRNKTLDVRTYRLPGGGMLTPKFPAYVEASIKAIHYVDAVEKEYSDEAITVHEPDAYMSAVYVKNGGLATLEHAFILTSGSGDVSYLSPDAGTRWGLNSVLYSSLAGRLIADDVTITAGGEGSAAHALYLGYIRLTNSNIQCDNIGGNCRGMQVTYGGRMDLEKVAIETWNEDGSILRTDAGGGTINARNITGVAHGDSSSGIYVDGYGIVSVEGSELRCENASVVVICANGEATVKDSTLISGTTAIKTHPFGQNCRAKGSGAFSNTRIISGKDAFYYNGMSADIIVENGTTVEFPQGCRLIRADSVKDSAPGSEEDLDLTDGTFTAKNVELNGDVEVAEDGTRLKLSFEDCTRYKGAVNGASVSIDSTSSWTVTETCIITGIDAESASHIICPEGFRVYYDAEINDVGKILLKGGGELVPIQDA